MARSAGDPKVRYIGFRLLDDAGLARPAMIAAIKDHGTTLDATAFETAAPWLTRFDGHRGILRCHHHSVAFTQRLLDTLESPTLETVGTSGTIRSLTEKHLTDLQDHGKDPRAKRSRGRTEPSSPNANAP